MKAIFSMFLITTLSCLLITACDQTVTSDGDSSGTSQFEMTVVNANGKSVYKGTRASFWTSRMKSGSYSPYYEDSLTVVFWPPIGYPASAHISFDTTAFHLSLHSDHNGMMLGFKRMGRSLKSQAYELISNKSMRSFIENPAGGLAEVMAHGIIGPLTFVIPDSGSIQIRESDSLAVNGSFQIWVSHFHYFDNALPDSTIVQPTAISGTFTATKDTTLTMDSVSVKPIMRNTDFTGKILRDE